MSLGVWSLVWWTYGAASVVLLMVSPKRKGNPTVALNFSLVWEAVRCAVRRCGGSAGCRPGLDLLGPSDAGVQMERDWLEAYEPRSGDSDAIGCVGHQAGAQLRRLSAEGGLQAWKDPGRCHFFLVGPAYRSRLRIA
ncbi:hypothetical protein CMEL01_03088 [Colletotrichum melonis]|uniref:Uncharacterized protein n=1 Tax=Colletotrichum melonis TaxID=1209925 RepID=A0AAI9XTZ2_9PEZI|nr:hypothetical protein CMEL01_03088 [Colletotrichum melonis]